ncbi:MAG: UPF0489 family protein [Candidatus Margulisiibacteriota bacterium]
MEVVGYYSNSACNLGMSNNMPVKEYFLAEKEAEIYPVSIYSPINLFQISDIQSCSEDEQENCPMIEPEILFNLLNSGNYYIEAGGKVRSVFLSENMAMPNLGPEYYPYNDVFTTALIAGTIDDIRGGQHAVLSYINSKKNPPERIDLTGLAECVRIEGSGRLPIYVLDQHNLAYFAWAESRAMGYLSETAVLLHIDAHADNNDPKFFLPANAGLDQVSTAITNQQFAIASFIFPAIENRMVGDAWGVLYNYGSESFMKFPLTSRGSDQFTPANLFEFSSIGKNIILDIDLDAIISVPGAFDESAETDEEVEKRIGILIDEIKPLIESGMVSVVTIATSPGFTDQTKSIDAAKQLVAAIQNPI